MLTLQRLEIEGFGPFADRQVLLFPPRGVTVVYGENMRGKTSLLNAIRYAFFGTVLQRGSRERRLHTVTNRELVAAGTYGFEVALALTHDGIEYELVRTLKPLVAQPKTDSDYEQVLLLRRGTEVLGPQERDHQLHQIFPAEISRFFLFDGELLQEYEELLINESETGRRISEAVERILGVPILKRGRAHLKALSDQSDKAAAKEASRNQETQAIGVALQQATEQREAHQDELERLTKQLAELESDRTELEQHLQTVQKYASLLDERDRAESSLAQAMFEEQTHRIELRAAMSTAWRSLVAEPIRAARIAAQEEAAHSLDQFQLSLRTDTLTSGHCSICDRDLSDHEREHLQLTVLQETASSADSKHDLSITMARLAALNRVHETDNAGEIRQLWDRIESLQIDQVTLEDTVGDLKTALSEADPDSIRRSRATYSEIHEKIAAVRIGLSDTTTKIQEQDDTIKRLHERLGAVGAIDLRAAQLQATTLRDAADVFALAVDRYKTALRERVEGTASLFFSEMTTEKEDYDGLAINEAYGLQIRHHDGRMEEARSAGAEHVVALALMGALQNNAPLRGPIVMDSPFGRLDEGHTSNVIQTLPEMAEQIILLVYEAEVGKSVIRSRLGGTLAREYQLERVSARRSNVIEVA